MANTLCFRALDTGNTGNKNSLELTGIPMPPLLDNVVVTRTGLSANTALAAFFASVLNKDFNLLRLKGQLDIRHEPGCFNT